MAIDYGSPQANALLGGGASAPATKSVATIPSKVADYGSDAANTLLGGAKASPVLPGINTPFTAETKATIEQAKTPNPVKLLPNFSDFTKTQTSTPSVALKQNSSSKNEYSGLDKTPVGDTLSSANPNNKSESFISKTINSIKDFFVGESPDQRFANQAVQKTIVDNNLVKIGTQLGLDKKFPIDTTKDKITAEYNQSKQIADYVRNNWDTIKSQLQDPNSIPDHPEMLGPKYADVQKNVAKYEKQLGVRDTPTNKEALTAVLLAPVAGAILAEGVIPVALSFAGFTAFSYAEHAILGDSLAGKASDALGLNSNIRDALDVVEMFGVGYGLHAAYLKAPEFAQSWTKNIVETYMPGQQISFEPEQVFDMLSGRNAITTAEQRVIFNKLGLTSEQMLVARRNGLPVNVAPEKILTLVDKPYWSKIKDLFHVTTNPEEISRTNIGETKVGAENRPNRLLGDGLKKTEEGGKILQKEIQDSIKTNGAEATHQMVADKLGVDSVTASKLITEAQRAQFIKNADVHAQTIAQSVSATNPDGTVNYGSKEANDLIQSTKKTTTQKNEVKKPEGTIVSVNGKDHILTGKAEKTYLEEKKRSDTYIKNLQKTNHESSPGRIKAEGMKFSAFKRDLTGQYTTIELNKKIKEEQSNYSGKKVLVDVNGTKVNGTIVGKPSYGKFKVKLENGSTVSKTKNLITDPRSTKEIVDKIVARKESKLYDPNEETSPKLEGALTPYDTKEILAAREKAKSIVPTSDIKTPEREALRKEITDKTYGNGAKVKGKRLDIVMGGPGSRKSSMIAEPLAEEHGSLIADSDRVKPQLPEFGAKGEGAGQVHLESAKINSDILKRGLKNGDNIVYPTVGKTIENLHSIIDTAKSHGYNVHLHHADLALEKAIPSTIERWMAGHQGFVDPHYSHNEVGLRPKENYGILKGDERLKSTTSYNVDVPRGQQPKVIHTRGTEQGRLAFEQQGLDSGGKEGASNGSGGTNNGGKPKVVSGTGETKTRGLSQGVEEKAIANKLTDSLGDLPEYKTVNMKDQAAQATELLNTDYEKAKRIAMGMELPQGDLLPEAVFIAVENKAIQDVDVNTLRDLATSSNLNAEATTMGQRIRTLAERDPNSPVKAIRDVSETREKLATKRTKNIKQAKEKTVSDIKTEIKKAVPKKETWSDFIDSITC